MFIGHFGVAMGAKRISKELSLGTLFMAVQFPDLIWPTLLLLDIEKVSIHPELGGTKAIEFVSYPFTHSLLGTFILAGLFAGFYFLVKKDFRNAVLLGVAVLSHWFLDFIVHFQDLPLSPGGSLKTGLGLWASTSGTLFVELILFIGGIILYLHSIGSLGKRANVFFWVNIVLLILVEISNFWGTPPASVKTLAWSAQFQWLFVIIAYLTEKKTPSSLEKVSWH